MTSKVIVFVADGGDQRFGEVSVFDSSGEAERLLETLLEAGYDWQRIRVFYGGEMEARVSQRPVVALVTGDQEEVSESEAPGRPGGPEGGCQRRRGRTGGGARIRGERVPAAQDTRPYGGDDAGDAPLGWVYQELRRASAPAPGAPLSGDAGRGFAAALQARCPSCARSAGSPATLP